MLIDATINLDYDPDPDFGGARFPPTVWPSPEDEKAASGALEASLGSDKKSDDHEIHRRTHRARRRASRSSTG